VPAAAIIGSPSVLPPNNLFAVLFSDAKAAENFAEQIVAGELTGDFA
jgi:hypothetical protein